MFVRSFGCIYIDRCLVGWLVWLIPFSLQRKILTDEQTIFGGEAVWRDLEVERGGTLSDTAGDIVVGTVARAEPSSIFTGFADGDTAQMGADAW